MCAYAVRCVGAGKKLPGVHSPLCILRVLRRETSGEKDVRGEKRLAVVLLPSCYQKTCPWVVCSRDFLLRAFLRGVCFIRRVVSDSVGAFLLVAVTRSQLSGRGHVGVRLLE
jgi:hypothetical protein